MNRKNNKRKINRNRRKALRRRNRVVDVVPENENNADVNQNSDPQQSYSNSVRIKEIISNDPNWAIVARGLGHYSCAVYTAPLTLMLLCLAGMYHSGNPSFGKMPDFENETAFMCFLQILPNASLALILLAGVFVLLYHLIYSLILLSYTPKSAASHPVLIILFSWIVWFIGAPILFYQSLLPGDVCNPQIVTWGWLIFFVSYFPFFYVFSKYEKIFSNSESGWGCSVGFFILLLLLIGASSSYFPEPVIVLSICGAILYGIPISVLYLGFIESNVFNALKYTNQLAIFHNSLDITGNSQETNDEFYEDSAICTVFNFPVFLVLIIIAIMTFVSLSWTETLWQLI